MIKPWIHALSSARKFGGRPEDYLELHNLMDVSKSSHADVRHRAVFHHALGPFIMERVFGTNLINSDGKEVSVRTLAEMHVIEDVGRIPSLSEWLEGMPVEAWMGGSDKIHDLIREGKIKVVD